MILNNIDNAMLGTDQVEKIYLGQDLVWTNGNGPDYASMYLTIEALEDGDFYVRKANVSYSVNGAAWETTTGETALSMNQGDEVRFKGTGGARGLFTNNSITFNAFGNVESLVYGDDFVGKTSIGAFEAFRYMFQSCSNIMSCKNLILPATGLGNGCYNSMFYNCPNLTYAPELPGVELKQNCYFNMFWGCSKINYIKCLAESGFSNTWCLNDWLSGVSPTGTFVKKAGVNWPTGPSGIPSGWTVIEE